MNDLEATLTKLGHPTHKSKGCMPTIVQKTKKYALEHLQYSRCAKLPFHNVRHTLDVYLNTGIIGHYQEISHHDLELVQLAALLHDLGNANGFDGHEEASMQIAEEHLRSLRYERAKIAIVLKCIEATKMPQSPRNELEEIVCDGDLYHLGTQDFSTMNASLRKEWAEFKDLRFNDKEWCSLNIHFLENHNYFTRYGKEVLQNGKAENMRLLKEKLSRIK